MFYVINFNNINVTPRYKLHATSYTLQVTRYKLHATSYTLKPAYSDVYLRVANDSCGFCGSGVSMTTGW